MDLTTQFEKTSERYNNRRAIFATQPPALGKAAARRIPNARLVEIAEAGRLPQVDAFPKYVRALVDFIAGGSGSGLSPTRQV